ncbi:MAG: hypothetical protein M3N26_12260 [Pseudomonadota bacterium]|nr:hypothetical protein [Pseudomonadota bacterium]
MSRINHSSSAEILSTSAAVALMTSGHDEGLCHDHHWARDEAAERRSYPRVAHPASISTPSSAVHDDIHYAS